MNALQRRWFHTERLSDEQFVNRMRRHVDRLTRWRTRLVVFNGFLLAATFALAVCAGIVFEKLFNGFQANAGNFALVGLLIGIVFGLKLGFLCHTAVTGLLFALEAPNRAQALMLRYHDALTHLSIGSGTRDWCEMAGTPGITPPEFGTAPPPR